MKCFDSGPPASHLRAAKPDKPFFDRRLQQLRGIRDPELFHHIGSMSLDGFDADFQPYANLAIFQAIPNQLEDLLFPVGQ